MNGSLRAFKIKYIYFIHESYLHEKMKNTWFIHFKTQPVRFQRSGCGGEGSQKGSPSRTRVIRKTTDKRSGPIVRQRQKGPFVYN